MKLFPSGVILYETSGTEVRMRIFVHSENSQENLLISISRCREDVVLIIRQRAMMNVNRAVTSHEYSLTRFINCQIRYLSFVLYTRRYRSDVPGIAFCYCEHEWIEQRDIKVLKIKILKMFLVVYCLILIDIIINESYLFNYALKKI